MKRISSRVYLTTVISMFFHCFCSVQVPRLYSVDVPACSPLDVQFGVAVPRDLADIQRRLLTDPGRSLLSTTPRRPSFSWGKVAYCISLGNLLLFLLPPEAAGTFFPGFGLTETSGSSSSVPLLYRGAGSRKLLLSTMAAALKLGSRADVFRKQGQEWYAQLLPCFPLHAVFFPSSFLIATQ
jgi:hypothetical protein